MTFDEMVASTFGSPAPFAALIPRKSQGRLPRPILRLTNPYFHGSAHRRMTAMEQFIAWFEIGWEDLWHRTGPCPIVGLVNETTLRLHWFTSTRPTSRTRRRVQRWLHVTFPLLQIDVGAHPACVIHEDCLEESALGVACWRDRYVR